jgi:DNA-binding MarR family transcriptional regulator
VRTAVVNDTLVSRLKTDLAAVVEEAKANDPKALRKQIASLEAELKKPRELAVDTVSLEMAEERGHDNGWAKGYARGLEAGRQAQAAGMAAFGAAFDKAIEDARRVAGMPLASGGHIPAGKTYIVGSSKHERILPKMIAHISARTEQATKKALADMAQHVAQRSGNRLMTPVERGVELPKGERLVLTAIAQFDGKGVEQDQLFVLTGYKGTSIKEYLSRLRAKGYICSGWPVQATDAGVAALGPDFEPLPTGRALLDHWRGQLPAGELKVLEVVVSHYPDGISSADLGERTEYKPTSVKEYVSRLKAKRLVERRSGVVVASGELFA